MDVRGVENDWRTPLRPVDRIDPGLVPVRGRIGRAPRDEGSDHVHQTHRHAARHAQRRRAARRSLHRRSAESKGAAARKTATKLVAAGLAKETTAKPGAHVWRRDDATGLAYALKVTPAGLMAIAIEDAEAAEPAFQISPPATGEVPTNIVDHEAAAENVAGSTTIAMPREGSKLAGVVDLLRHEDGATIDQLADPSPAGAIQSPSPSRSAPRSGTKLAQVTKLLQRDDGATIDELIATTGWLAHTTRAALTGLRKRGYAVTIDRSHKERGSIYRINADRIAEGRPAVVHFEEAQAPSVTVSMRAERQAKFKARRAA